jgi:caspase domain-containing protein
VILIRTLVCIVLLLMMAARAGAETRIALVIGVGVYDSPDIQGLPNAVNDARAVHAKLGELGFGSVLLENPTRRELRAALGDLFSRRKRLGADTVLVFFAGHGVQFRNEGYLLARDSVLAPANELETRQEISVSHLLDAVGEAKLAILLLDACRNSPAFAARLAWLSNHSVAAGLPLAADITTDAVVSYSAEPGASAIDGLGTDRNSPYSQALLDYMGRPDLELSQVLQGVRRFVESATQSQQSPVFEDRRRPDHAFYFRQVSAPTNEHLAASRPPPSEPGRLSGKEAAALLAGKMGPARAEALAGLLTTPGVSPPLSVPEALTLLGDIPVDGGRRRSSLGALLPLLDLPISPQSAENLLSGLGETSRLAALTDMIGCLVRPVPERAARQLVEGIPRQDMPRLLRELTASGGSARCGGDDGASTRSSVR